MSIQSICGSVSQNVQSFKNSVLSKVKDSSSDEIKPQGDQYTANMYDELGMGKKTIVAAATGAVIGAAAGGLLQSVGAFAAAGATVGGGLGLLIGNMVECMGNTEKAKLVALGAVAGAAAGAVSGAVILAGVGMVGGGPLTAAAALGTLGAVSGAALQMSSPLEP